MHHLRDDVIPSATAGTALVVNLGGQTASAVDFSDVIGARLPIFIGAVLVLSFLLLMLVFRSVLVPLKAVLMNLLSIGAAYGVIVAAFQWGWGGNILGVSAGPIEAWVPMMLFAIVFGLSMDYEVFLISAIREHYDRSGDNGQAVADGLESTARVITAAALIMVFVFGSFIVSDVRALKLIGLGLAVAVAIDASIVRVVLVPATMELLGKANWWLPRWLDKILPDDQRRGRDAHRRGDRSRHPRARHHRRLIPLPGQSSGRSGGKPPVAIGPKRSISMRMMHFPCLSIAARYSSQSECSPEMPRK